MPSRAGRLDEWERELKDQLWETAFATLTCLPTNDIGGIEPFGFDDGISQPVLDWERKKSARIHNTTAYTNLSALGEMLLGYPNECGKYTDRPLLDPGDDPERDSAGRRRTCPARRTSAATARTWSCAISRRTLQPSGSSSTRKRRGDREERDRVAAATVGRLPADIPVVPSASSRSRRHAGSHHRSRARRSCR